MPAPTAKAVKALFDDALKTYKDLGPEYAVRHIINTHSLSVEDVALAFLAPDALDAKSSMTAAEKKQFDADMKAVKANQAEREKADEPPAAISGAPAKAGEINADSSPEERAAASATSDVAGPAGGDLNPRDGGEKKPPVGGDYAKPPKK
jgi:hypothetical protein